METFLLLFIEKSGMLNHHELEACGFTDAAQQFNRLYPDARKTGKATVSRPGKEGSFPLEQLC